MLFFAKFEPKVPGIQNQFLYLDYRTQGFFFFSITKLAYSKALKSAFLNIKFLSTLSYIESPHFSKWCFLSLDYQIQVLFNNSELLLCIPL